MNYLFLFLSMDVYNMKDAIRDDSLDVRHSSKDNLCLFALGHSAGLWIFKPMRRWIWILENAKSYQVFLILSDGILR